MDKFCVDCKYYRKAAWFLDGEHDMCDLPINDNVDTNLVRGKEIRLRCVRHRTSSTTTFPARCGPQGRFFEPKG
jgi:hypothetical protein